jgi:hypothetical protein
VREIGNIFETDRERTREKKGDGVMQREEAGGRETEGQRKTGGEK